MPRSGKTSKVVFTITGQGAHYAGMGGDLFETSPAFRATITCLVGGRALLVHGTCKEGTRGMIYISGTPYDVASILF